MNWRNDVFAATLTHSHLRDSLYEDVTDMGAPSKSLQPRRLHFNLDGFIGNHRRRSFLSGLHGLYNHPAGFDVNRMLFRYSLARFIAIFWSPLVSAVLSIFRGLHPHHHEGLKRDPFRISLYLQISATLSIFPGDPYGLR